MLHACGITAFLIPESVSDSASLLNCATGDIKQAPEDFVVVEIDPTGQRTDADAYVFPFIDQSSTVATDAEGEVEGNAKEAAGEFVKNAASAASESGTADVQTLEEFTKISTRSVQQLLDEVMHPHTAAITTTLGSATAVAQRVTSTFSQTDLTRLIGEMCSGGSSSVPTPGTASAPWWSGGHELGVVPDKRERHLLHLLVRRCFPHLRSYAESPSAVVVAATPFTPSAAPSPQPRDTTFCLFCALDLHYLLFCATLGAEAAACIAQWAVCAQAARQGRSLDAKTRQQLQALTPHDEQATPISVAKGVCFTSFDALFETMRRHGPPDEDDTQDGRLAPLPTVVPLVSDKEARRQVHGVLRRFYPFVTCQVREGRVVLRYSPCPDQKNGAPRSGLSNSVSSGVNGTTTHAAGVRRSREEMEATGTAPPHSDSAADASVDLGYLHFIVRKRNLETAEMKQLIGEYCGLKDGAVCAAGMKDKKGITTQRCSVPTTVASSVRAALLASSPATPIVLRWPVDPQHSYAAVLHACLHREPVHIGQLKGNWFTIRVRAVRWATDAECAVWRGPSSSHFDGATGGRAEGETSPGFAGSGTAAECALRTFLGNRFQQCVEKGFVNYFGQQRFGETVEEVDDHTGVHLFAGRYVAAVKSLYRSCPEVYNDFPAKMEARFVPGNSRDAQVMTHALRQTYRMYFSEHALTREDVAQETGLWRRLCEKAITEGAPFFLRSLWVHAGQSVFFNVAASFVVGRAAGVSSASATKEVKRETSPSPRATHVDGSPAVSRDTTSIPASRAFAASLPPLPYNVIAHAQLPLGGYQVEYSDGKEERMAEKAARESAAADAAWQAWKSAAVAHALQELRWTKEQAFEQRKVAGVPVPGSWRAVVVRPLDASLGWETECAADKVEGERRSVASLTRGAAAAAPSAVPATTTTVRLSFALPSSSYATIFLREVLRCDKWW